MRAAWRIRIVTECYQQAFQKAGIHVRVATRSSQTFVRLGPVAKLRRQTADRFTATSWRTFEISRWSIICTLRTTLAASDSICTLVSLADRSLLTYLCTVSSTSESTRFRCVFVRRLKRSVQLSAACLGCPAAGWIFCTLRRKAFFSAKVSSVEYALCFLSETFMCQVC